MRLSVYFSTSQPLPRRWLSTYYQEMTNICLDSVSNLVHQNIFAAPSTRHSFLNPFKFHSAKLPDKQLKQFGKWNKWNSHMKKVFLSWDLNPSPISCDACIKPPSYFGYTCVLTKTILKYNKWNINTFCDNSMDFDGYLLWGYKKCFSHAKQM